MRFIVGILLFCQLFVSLPSYADPLDILKMLGRIYGINLDQLTALKDVKNLNEALKEVSEKQLSAITGHYNMGNLYNSAHEQSERLWTNDNWQSVLEHASGGNSARFQELLKSYGDKYPSLSGIQITPLNGNTLKAKTYQDNARTNLASLSVSECSYNGINDRIKKLQGLLNQIEQSPNEKASLDLQARLLAEIGFVQLELLRLQSVQTQLTAMHNQGMTNGTTQDAGFVKW